MENELIKKCWGTEEIIVNFPGLYCAKYLYVMPGFICSTHAHPIKHETFLCLGGTGIISVDGVIYPCFEGCKQTIPPGTWHFFATEEGMTLLEISTYHSDEDVQRRSESRALTVADHNLFKVLGENGTND